MSSQKQRTLLQTRLETLIDEKITEGLLCFKYNTWVSALSELRQQSEDDDDIADDFFLQMQAHLQHSMRRFGTSGN